MGSPVALSELLKSPLLEVNLPSPGRTMRGEDSQPDCDASVRLSEYSRAQRYVALLCSWGLFICGVGCIALWYAYDVSLLPGVCVLGSSILLLRWTYVLDDDVLNVYRSDDRVEVRGRGLLWGWTVEEYKLSSVSEIILQDRDRWNGGRAFWQVDLGVRSDHSGETKVLLTHMDSGELSRALGQELQSALHVPIDDRIVHDDNSIL